MLGGLTLGGDGAGDFPARRGCHRPRSSGILYPKRLERLPPLDGDARTCTTEPEETKHPVLQRRYLDTERSSVRGWQDLRAMRDSRGPCSEKCPFLARSSRGVSSVSYTHLDVYKRQALPCSLGLFRGLAQQVPYANLVAFVSPPRHQNAASAATTVALHACSNYFPNNPPKRPFF